jgi:hypothetical protein
MASVRWQAWSNITFKETKRLLAYFTKEAGQPVAFKANRKKPDGFRTGVGIVTFKDQATALKLLQMAGTEGSVDVSEVMKDAGHPAPPTSLVFVEPLNKSMQYVVTEDYMTSEVLSHNQAKRLLDQHYHRELDRFPGFFKNEDGQGTLTHAVALQNGVFEDVGKTRKAFGRQRAAKVRRSQVQAAMAPSDLSPPQGTTSQEKK